MSVIEGKNPTSLRMKFDLGKDELTNKTKVKSKTYSNLKYDANNQDIRRCNCIRRTSRISSTWSD